MVFEIKAIVINGEFPGPPDNKTYLEDTLFALSYIEKSAIEKLYSFEVSEKVQEELIQIAKILCNRFHDKRFASLDIIEGKIKSLESDKKFYRQQFQTSIDTLNQRKIDEFGDLICQSMYGIDLLKGIKYEYLERKLKETK